MLGINEASFGISESGNESGILMQLRQGAALNSLQELFDNLRYAQKALSIKLLKMAQTWTPSKLTQILGTPPTQEFYSKNFLKCDISVQESMLTDTQRQMYFTQLVDLYRLTSMGGQPSPITPMMLIEACPIQGGSELLQEIKKNVAEQQQSMQQQQQQENEYFQSMKDNLNASSLERLAMAKERLEKTPLTAINVEERKSKMTRETLLSALDAMKALNEFQGFSEEELLKLFLGFQKLRQNAPLSDSEGNKEKMDEKTRL